MNLHQVFAGIKRMGCDQFGIRTTDVVEVILFQDIATGWLWHDNVVALTHSVSECLDILLSDLGETFNVTTVQERRTTTLSCVGQ